MHLFIMLTYWSFQLLVPLIVGWSAICCVTDLMAFLQSDLPLARSITSQTNVNYIFPP